MPPIEELALEVLRHLEDLGYPAALVGVGQIGRVDMLFASSGIEPEVVAAAELLEVLPLVETLWRDDRALPRYDDRRRSPGS